MLFAARPLFVVLVLSAAAFVPAVDAAAQPSKVPGFNVHVVQQKPGSTFYRGGAPRKDTMEALARAAKAKGKTATLVDLRIKPTFKDDTSGKGGRLTPAQEAAMAKKLGIRYVAINALQKDLPAQLRKFQQHGDIYIHCMYGVNRTGFAVARFAKAAKVKVPTQGLGKRDVRQGDAFQTRLEQSAR